MKAVKLVIGLFFLITCLISCNQTHVVYVKDNNIYFKGKRLTNEKMDKSPVFVEEQNKVFFIRDIDEGDCRKSEIISYDLKNKTQSVVVKRDDDKSMSISYDTLMYVPHHKFIYFNRTSSACLSPYQKTEAYRYDFTNRSNIKMYEGSILKIIEKGKYKDKFVSIMTYTLDAPCDYFGFPLNYLYGIFICDEKGQKIGCLRNHNDKNWRDFDENAYDYENAKFNEPYCDTEPIETAFNVALEGLNNIRQYQNGDKSLNDDIDRLLEICDSITFAFRFDMLDRERFESFPESLKEKVGVIYEFISQSETYQNPYKFEITKYGFTKIKGYTSSLYELRANITNYSGSKISELQLFHEYESEKVNWLGNKTTEKKLPYVELQFENKQYEISQYDIWENYFVNNVNWKQGDEIKIKTVIGPFDNVLFDYTPISCKLIIPFEVRDPVGYEFKTSFILDILKEWEEYAHSFVRSHSKSLDDKSNVNKAVVISEADSKILKSLVHEWNDSHNNFSITNFNHLFSDFVQFYGTKLSKENCIKSKRTLFQKHPDFQQEIQSSIEVGQTGDNEFKCDFTKKVTINNKSTEYPSYLVFRKINKNWKIVTESDLVTDNNLARKNR